MGDVAAALSGARLISAEFMYKPRPSSARERRVFDFALASRLSELSRYDEAAVVLICNAAATVESFADLPAAYPRLRFAAAITNPEPVLQTPTDPYRQTPERCDWRNPAGWRRYALTDRWARITFALDVARELDAPGSLIMPAHDAVWGRGLLARLTRLSERHARNGLPAAVSPYSHYQHSVIPDLPVDPLMIDAVNAVFNRDSWLHWRLRSEHYQAFWGKMGMIPLAMCGVLRDQVETMVWEDDLEIDRAIRASGYAAVCRWIDNPALYRQTLPLFDRAGLRALIDRTLHYSLNIPGDSSSISRPLDWWGRWHRRIDPRYARALTLAEVVTAECRAEIAMRLDGCGASWVDWGAYRYVARVGDPLVQVWKYEGGML